MSPFLTQIDADFAEFLGVLLGDGCISRFVSGGRVIFEVAFTGNETESRYYRIFLKKIIESRFPIKGRLVIRGDNTVRLHFRSKRFAILLMSLGLPLGKKKGASIPLEVLNANQIIPFVRGFYHAEGSLFRRYSKQYSYHAKKYNHLLVIQFRCRLKTLMRQLREKITQLRIRPTRMGKKEGVSTFRITDQAQIKRFFKIVQPRYKTSPLQ